MDGNGGNASGGANKKKGYDPMDPSSYSDAPAGGWGAGMARNKMGTAGDDVDFMQYK